MIGGGGGGGGGGRSRGAGARLGPCFVGVLSNSAQNASEKRRGLCGGSWSWLGLGSEGMRN